MMFSKIFEKIGKQPINNDSDNTSYKCCKKKRKKY